MLYLHFIYKSITKECRKSDFFILHFSYILILPLTNFKNIKDGVEYVTKYCGRVAISENRILNYDGNSVTFCYNSHVNDSYHEVTVPASQFITILLRHLLPENFKIIRYFGFYRKKTFT